MVTPSRVQKNCSFRAPYNHLGFHVDRAGKARGDRGRGIRRPPVGQGNPLEDIIVIGGSTEWFDTEPEWKTIETLNLIMKDGVIYKNTL